MTFEGSPCCNGHGNVHYKFREITRDVTLEYGFDRFILCGIVMHVTVGAIV